MIRRAGLEDCAAIGRLLHDFNREYDEPTPTPEVIAERFERLLIGDTIVLLAGDAPDGVAVMRLRPSIWSEGLECYLAELYVVPALRGKGIGTELMGAVMDTARAEGATYIDLNTGEDDTGARALYERLGFSCREGKADGSVQLYYEREL